MAVYNAPIGNGTLQFNTNDFIVQNDKQLTFLEADSRYSQVNPVNTITGDDPVFTDHVRIGEKSGSATAGTNVVEIGSDETAISGTAARKVSLGCDAAVDAARPEGVNIGYKAGRVDSGKYDGTGINGDGLCVAVGYNSVAYQTTEGSLGVGTFSGAARSGFSTNRTAAVSIGAYAGRTKLGSGSTALGYGSGYGQVSEGGAERPFAPFCVGLNGTGTLINFGWDGDSRIDELTASERLFITPIRSFTSITPLNPMCYDTATREMTYD